MKNSTFRCAVPEDCFRLAEWGKDKLSENNGKPVILEAMTEKEAKSSGQNRAFHALLNCYYTSGVHSFDSIEEMRVYYKKIGGLVQVVRESLLPLRARNMLYRAVKILPLKDEHRRKIRTMLGGKKEVELSWSEASKEKATFVIDALLQDMFESGVHTSKQGGKFYEILEGMDKSGFYKKAA